MHNVLRLALIGVAPRPSITNITKHFIEQQFSMEIWKLVMKQTVVVRSVFYFSLKVFKH
jgi:hypothetical protein